MVENKDEIIGDKLQRISDLAGELYDTINGLSGSDHATFQLQTQMYAAASDAKGLLLHIDRLREFLVKAET